MARIEDPAQLGMFGSGAQPTAAVAPPITPPEDEDEGDTLAVFTWGYGNRSHNDLRNVIEKYGIKTVVDVRRSVEGRNTRWRASQLRQVFPEYIHFGALGNAFGTPDGEWCPNSDIAARQGVRQVAALYAEGKGPVLLICCEASPSGCHRKQVAEAVAKIVGGGIANLIV